MTCLKRLKIYRKKTVLSWQSKKNRRFLELTITDADYADDIAFLANSPTQAGSQLHSLQGAVGGIEHDVNTDKTEYICFNQIGDISTPKDGRLKLVD